MKIITLFLLFLTAANAMAADPATPDELIAAMHKKYEGKWYKTLVFAQKTVTYKPDSTTENGIWYEAYSAPGKLRIDYDPLSSGGGALYADGNLTSFRDGKPVNSRPYDHPLMILGFDVYFNPVAKTIEQLKRLNMDMTVLHQDKWQNRDVYVVGAKVGDLRSPQFWIDKKNLYFVRLINPVGPEGKSVQEIEFNKYEKVKGGGWIAPEVIVIVDGKKVFTEEYYGVKTNIALDNDLFDPLKFMTVDRNYFNKRE